MVGLLDPNFTDGFQYGQKIPYGGALLVLKGYADGNYFSVRNDSPSGILTIKSDENINGASEAYVSRKRGEWIYIEYGTSAKYTVKPLENKSAEIVVSSDGTLAAAQNSLSTVLFNLDDKILIVGCTTESENGVYELYDNSGTRAWRRINIGQCPLYPSQCYRETVLSSIGTTFTGINLVGSDFDYSGDDYTLNFASGRIEFDNTDGSKVYRVTIHGRFETTTDTSGGDTGKARLRATLDGTAVSRSEARAFLREDQHHDNDANRTFYVKPPTSASNNNYLEFEARTESSGTVPDVDLTEFTVNVERIV